MLKTTNKAAAAAGDAKTLKIVTIVLFVLIGVRCVDATGKWILIYYFLLQDYNVQNLGIN